MGLSSSKSTTKSTPYDPAAISAGSSALSSAYNTNQPAIQANANTVNSLVPSLAAQYTQGDPAVNVAEGYVGDVLGGKYLNGNPNLNGMIGQTDQNVRNQVNAEFSRAGQVGSSRQIGELGSQLANSENALRYSDYNTQMGRMDTAAGMAPGLSASRTVSIAPLLAAAQAGSSIPIGAAASYAGGLGSLLSPYGTQTSTQSQGLGSILGTILGSGLAGWASGGFKKI
jgi:hypothetical protein